jgi:N-acetylmuramoyl-L-alanine amidase
MKGGAMAAMTASKIVLGLACAAGMLSPSRAATPRCIPGSFKIAIDIGHTPEATGARSARGVTEYSFNLRLAEVVAATLKTAGFSQTGQISVRGTGRDQLVERTAQANRVLPDLLLSIHHDDTQQIFHNKWIVAGVSHDYSDHASGYSLFVSRKNVGFPQSLKFAKLLGSTLRDQGMSYSPHHAANVAGERRELIDPGAGVYLYDDLHVLRHSRAPAVLIEAGVIVNRKDEMLLASDGGRQKIANSVLRAVTEFCAGQAKP